MPNPKTHRIFVTFKSKQEAEKVRKKADKLGLTISNYFRSLAGLEPLKWGGKREKNTAI